MDYPDDVLIEEDLDELIELPTDLLDDEHEEYIILTPETETLIVQFEEGTCNENLDMKFRFDMEFDQTSAICPTENFCIMTEWNNEDLSFYLAHAAYRTIYGMITVILTNRKTGMKTIGQKACTIGFNHFIRPLTFKNVRDLFSNTVFVEFYFDRDDEIIHKNWISTFFHNGMLQLETETLIQMAGVSIDFLRNECLVQTEQNVFDVYEFENIKKMCKDGYSNQILASLHRLSTTQDVSFLVRSQETLLTLPWTVLEFLIFAEAYGLDIVKERTLAKLKKQSEVKILARHTKYLGPKVIRELLSLFKLLPTTGPSIIPRDRIAPAEETELMKTTLVSWKPQNSLNLPHVKAIVDAVYTETDLFFTFEISSDDRLVVLKQVQHETEQPVRPSTVAACRPTLTPKYFGDSSVLRKSEFDVHVEHDESIRFIVAYGEKRESTLWSIKCSITLCLKRADNTKLWEYNLQHIFSWNSQKCVVNAITETILKRNYQGKIQFSVAVKVLESEGFVKVDQSVLDRCIYGRTNFNVTGSLGNDTMTVENRKISAQSNVLRTLIETSFTFNLETLTKNIHFHEVSKRSLDYVLNKNSAILELDLCDPINQEIPVLARTLQHRGAMDAVSENLKRKYTTTDCLRVAEIFTYDDVQAWCCSQIQSVRDFNKIKWENLEERSAAAVFSALRNF